MRNDATDLHVFIVICDGHFFFFFLYIYVYKFITGQLSPSYIFYLFIFIYRSICIYTSV